MYSVHQCPLWKLKDDGVQTNCTPSERKVCFSGMASNWNCCSCVYTPFSSIIQTPQAYLDIFRIGSKALHLRHRPLRYVDNIESQCLHQLENIRKGTAPVARSGVLDSRHVLHRRLYSITSSVAVSAGCIWAVSKPPVDELWLVTDDFETCVVTTEHILFGGLEYYFPYIGNHTPNWLSYFSEG